MTQPQPAFPLTGACTVIHNNTLYAYSKAGFQSLSLSKEAEWVKLADGLGVEGGVCVGAERTDAAQAAMFVVGGTSAGADYKGLQKFTYSTGKWDSISPQEVVTQDRLHHGAIYLSKTDSILVYAGSQVQGRVGLSSQTFTIGASPPYAVLSYPSADTPPAEQPLLLPWADGQAAMIGGEVANTKVMVFDTERGWFDSGSTLSEPLVTTSNQVKATLMTGVDGSKHLFTFDSKTSPNVVNRTMLVDGSGKPIQKAAPASNKRRRDLTAGGWPSYNASLAPGSVRSEFSLASDPSGLVVISGGRQEEALSVFDAANNRWNNATALLVSEKQAVLTPPLSTMAPSQSSQSSQSSSPVLTDSQSASSAPSATGASSSATTKGLAPTAVLGIALGAIFGVAIILVALLFFIKSKRQKLSYIEARHHKKSNGLPPLDEKALPALDMGPAPGHIFPGNGQPPGGSSTGHGPKGSAGSFSSMAILMGKVTKSGGQSNRAPDEIKAESGPANTDLKSKIGRPQAQPGIESDFVPKDDKVSFAPATNEPKPRTGHAVNPDGETRRSSGWNRYWSGGSTLNTLGYAASKRDTTLSDTSNYSDTHQRMTQDSAVVPPLMVPEGRPEFSAVITGSPTLSQYDNRLNQEMSGLIERPISTASSSGYSIAIPASVQEDGDAAPGKKQWGTARPPSSSYSQSLAPAASTRPPTGVSQQPQRDTALTSSDMSWLNLGPKRT